MVAVLKVLCDDMMLWTFGIQLHCDSLYYLYEIFMTYVFKMSIAIH